jgi:hypothetical protein
MTIKNLYPASRPSLDLNFAKLKRLDTIARLTYYPVRLPDATLQALTAS